MKVWHSWKRFLVVECVLAAVSGTAFYVRETRFFWDLPFLGNCPISPDCKPGVPCPQFILNGSCVPLVAGIVYDIFVVLLILNTVGFIWFSMADFIEKKAAVSPPEIKTSSILRRNINLPLWFWLGLCGLSLVPILWYSSYIFAFIFPFGILPLIVLTTIVVSIPLVMLGINPNNNLFMITSTFSFPTLLGAVVASLFWMVVGIVLGLLTSWIWRIKRPE